MTAPATFHPPAPGSVPEDFEPKTAEEWARALADPMWRICSGKLYKIIIKGSEDEPGHVIPFRPNQSQRDFVNKIHYLNIILKARQLGFTSLAAILWLDHALFVPDQRCGIIAQDREAAESIFRDKVRFGYDNLPAALRERMPLKIANKSLLAFSHNNSSIRVATSMRGGTINRLHISEMGKIAAKNPDKAVEIVTGSFQAVPTGHGIIVVESTAEGKSGEFFTIADKAEKKQKERKATGRPILDSEFQFHFFPWWKDPTYRLPIDQARHVAISAKEHEYFDTVEGVMDCDLDLGQRAWYVAKRDNTFAASPDMMLREYPSTSEECWQQSSQGKFYHAAMARARKDGRIGNFPLIRHVPVNSFWDLGATDSTAVWLHQRIGPMDRWVRYREASGEGLLPFVLWMESMGCTWGTHFLPHDASHQKQGIEQTTSTLSQFREIRPSWNFVIVPRVQTIQHGIDLVRADFDTYEFDEEGCKEGIAHIEAYSREWNNRLMWWTDQPRHDEHSHACLVAGTPIETARGFVPIEHVRPGDQVRIPHGWACVDAARQTGTRRHLITVETNGGHRVTLTPDHKIFTARGVVRADELRVDDKIIIGKDDPCLKLESAISTGYRDAFIASDRSHLDPASAVGIAALSRDTMPENVPVFDLTVDHHHCYFAGGLLVSNCDALRQKAQAFEDFSDPGTGRPKRHRRRATGLTA